MTGAFHCSQKAYFNRTAIDSRNTSLFSKSLIGELCYVFDDEREWFLIRIEIWNNINFMHTFGAQSEN